MDFLQMGKKMMQKDSMAATWKRNRRDAFQSDFALPSDRMRMKGALRFIGSDGFSAVGQKDDAERFDGGYLKT